MDDGTDKPPAPITQSEAAAPAASESEVVEKQPSNGKPESSPPNPFSRLDLKEPNGNSPKINITSSSNKNASLKRDRPSSPGAKPSRKEILPEEWEDRTLSSLFRITLDPERQKDNQGYRLHFLENSRTEIEESGEVPRLSTGVLDQTLLEAASSLDKNTKPLDYFVSCFKKVSRQFKALRRNGEQNSQFQVVKEARRLCMSYCIFAITMPEMFGSVPKDCHLAKSYSHVVQFRNPCF